MNNITRIGDLCFGCRSCEQSCPKKCIKIEADQEGFLYPIVEDGLCVECGVCLKKCPANNLDYHRNAPNRVFGLRNKNDIEIMDSASGGASDVIAKYILKNGGVVFGAAYDEKLHVNHIEVKRLEEKKKIQSSKYVQSNLLDTYTKAKNYLENNICVLFTGTPCQISGLYSYLSKNYENLYTLDLICHGVPSPKFFEKYIEYQSKKIGEPVLSYNFRDKEKRGWGTHYMLKTKTKTKTRPLSLDKYGKHFMDGDCYRRSCYQCPFANTNRVGDITVGDFWGISKCHPEFYSEKGVSSIFVNTEKGMKLVNNIRDDVYLIDSNLEEGLIKQGNMVSPTKFTENRDTIYRDINLEKFITSMKVKIRLFSLIKLIVPSKIYNYLKSM